MMYPFCAECECRTCVDSADCPYCKCDECEKDSPRPIMQCGDYRRQLEDDEEEKFSDD